VDLVALTGVHHENIFRLFVKPVSDLHALLYVTFLLLAPHDISMHLRETTYIVSKVTLELKLVMIDLHCLISLLGPNLLSQMYLHMLSLSEEVRTSVLY
jgi:hypothetical protein